MARSGFKWEVLGGWSPPIQNQIKKGEERRGVRGERRRVRADSIEECREEIGEG